MSIIEKLKMRYHMLKIVKSIKKGDKNKYDKHTAIISDIIWETITRA